MKNQLWVTMLSKIELKEVHNTGRNEDCPCSSKKKYKKCHQTEVEKEWQLRNKIHKQPQLRRFG